MRRVLVKLKRAKNPKNRDGSLWKVHLARHCFIAHLSAQPCKQRVRLDIDYSRITLQHGSIQPIESLVPLAEVDCLS